MLLTLEDPTTLPVSLDDAKLALRVDSDDHDVIIEDAIRAAADFIEQHTTLVLQPKRMQQRFLDWDNALDLCVAPVREVTEVSYLDEDGNEQTLDAPDWHWDRTTEGARVGFATNFSPPKLARERAGAVRVTFDAGYDPDGASPADPEFTMPARARQVLLSLAGHWYDHPGEYVMFNRPGASGSGVDAAASAALAQLRVFR